MAFQNKIIIFIVFAIMFYSSFVEGSFRSNVLRKFYSEDNDINNGTKWAVLIAGSNGFRNYRHQADICHAYQILKNGGLKDENIIVFMYDDIAYDVENPNPGVIINNPNGVNVYPGVPKDYTGANVNASNIYAVILGDKDGVKGGSGKVLNTNQNDHIFIYYADHGSPGILGMPDDQIIYAIDFINVLKKKHASKSYKSMVIYVEACESGSIFDGLLPTNLNIYATTASNATESSYGCYCSPDHPKGYENVCLGDSYSVAWMEDSEKVDRLKETLEEQFETVKKLVINVTEGVAQEGISHVMRYGDISISSEVLGDYMGINYSKKDYTTAKIDSNVLNVIEQREADLFYLQQKVKRAKEGSKERIEAQKQLDDEISRRKHVDKSVEAIGLILLGPQENGLSLNNIVRPAGQPLVDDWDCFKSMIETYEASCGSLGNYGRKYTRAFANMCNAGCHVDQMVQALARVCA